MTIQNQIYKCNTCGGLLEVVVPGGNQIACCGQEMELLTEKTADVGKEKHVPVIEKTKKGILVKIGSVPHPMESAHYIQLIEILWNGRSYKKFLKPGDKPEAEFEISAQAGGVVAREHCNLHGLWRN